MAHADDIADPLANWAEREKRLEAFEEAWRRGEQPRVEDYLPPDGPERSAVLPDLVRVDLECRLKAGMSVHFQDYLRQYEELNDQPDVVEDLRELERQQRRRREAAVDYAHIGADQAAESSELRSGTMPTGIYPPPPLAPPKSPPGYEIMGELGRGGMGIVLKARQLSLKRVVALKMIRGGAYADAEELSRFRAEAEAVAQVKHPNIVSIYEIGEHDGRPFFATELAEAGSLQKQLAGNPQPPRAAALLIEKLALAMQAAHDCGIIHRDLKPANVLLTPTDSHHGLALSSGSDNKGTATGEETVRFFEPKITDFGLAKRLGEESGQTRTGQVMGTPSYMAPEQAEGRIRDLGPQTDVYALGAILYEVLTGRPPFKGASVTETLKLVCKQDPVPPRRLQPGVPRDLETICLKCLEKEGKKRYACAQALAEDLRRFLNLEPIRARRATAAERLIKFARRKPAHFVVLVAIVLVGLGLIGGFLWHTVDLRDRLAQALRKERESTRKIQGAVEAARVSQLRAAASELISRGQAAIAKGKWDDAADFVGKALTQTVGEAMLADLNKQAEDSIRDIKGRKEARTNLLNFFKLRDDAIYYQTLHTGLGDRAENYRKAAATAQQALALFQPTADSLLQLPRAYFSEQERRDITASCYHLLLVQAEAAVHKKDVTQALAFLDRAAALLPSPTQAYYLRRARYLAKQGQKEAAARARRRALTLAPVDALDFFLLGEEQYQLGNWSDAIRSFSAALLRDPNHFSAHALLAICYMYPAELRPELARANLTACIGQRPKTSWLYVLRAFADTQLGQYTAAESDFREALKYGPGLDTRYGVHVNRGYLRFLQATATPIDDLAAAGCLLAEPAPLHAALLAMALRDKRTLAEAARDLKEAIALEPKELPGYINLAKVYMRQNKEEQARAQLDRAIREHPDKPVLYRERAQIFVQMNQETLALDDLDLALSYERPGSADQAADLVQKGRILFRMGKYREALAAANVAARIRPDHRNQQLCSQALLKLGREREALAAMDNCERLGESKASFYEARGRLRAKLGNHRGAIEDYTRALAVQKSADTFIARGWVYVLAFRSPRLAFVDFAEAVRRQPQNGEAYRGRAYAQVLQGKVHAAEADIEKALKLGPTSPRTLAAAARVFAQAIPQLRAVNGANGRRDAEEEARLEQRALGLLRQAIGVVAEEERASFWQSYIEPDIAYVPLWRNPEFRRLAAALKTKAPDSKN